MKLHRIEAEVIEYNEISQSFFKKFNFKEEVELRNFLFRKGKWWNLITFAKLSSD